MWLLIPALTACKNSRDLRSSELGMDDTGSLADDSGLADDTGPLRDLDRSLHFNGMGHLEVAIDDPSNVQPGGPADVGSRDFTIEFWLKAALEDNTANFVECGNNTAWDQGNLLVDATRFDRSRGFGASLTGNTVVFGTVLNGQAMSLCGAFDVLDEEWHHVAIERRASNGQLFLFIDGGIQAVAKGPAGDLSYPDDESPSGSADPFLVFGAEKHSLGLGYTGYMDEIRISTKLRYEASFELQTTPFSPDGQTAVLWHLDNGEGLVVDDKAVLDDSPTEGSLILHGQPPAPTWSDEHAL